MRPGGVVRVPDADEGEEEVEEPAVEGEAQGRGEVPEVRQVDEEANAGPEAVLEDGRPLNRTRTYDVVKQEAVAWKPLR